MSQASIKKGIPWAWIVVGLFVGFLVAAFGIKALEGMVSYYVTVEEAMASPESFEGKRLKLAGYVAEDNFYQEGQRYEFDVAYGDGGVKVVYEGFAPDTFGTGVDVIVEGELVPSDEGWVFEADTLMAKCASKYEVGEIPNQDWQAE